MTGKHNIFFIILLMKVEKAQYTKNPAIPCNNACLNLAMSPDYVTNVTNNETTYLKTF